MWIRKLCIAVYLSSRIVEGWYQLLWHSELCLLATEPSLWPGQSYGTVFLQQFVKQTLLARSSAKLAFSVCALTMFDFDFCNALPVRARVRSGTVTAIYYYYYYLYICNYGYNLQIREDILSLRPFCVSNCEPVGVGTWLVSYGWACCSLRGVRTELNIAETARVSQYGNEAPGAPSIQAELAKLREENTVLKRTAKGISSFVFVIFYFAFK